MSNAQHDQNHIPTLIGVSSVDGITVIPIYVDPVTHRMLVDLGGGGAVSFVDNEIVSGSATTFTLANTPTVGSVHVYGSGQRLTPGAGNDYTISGSTITTVNSYSAGSILADYRK